MIDRPFSRPPEHRGPPLWPAASFPDTRFGVFLGSTHRRGSLGVTRSLSRPRVSDDNPFSEAQFKTLKYHPGFPRRFHDITAAIAFCRTFFPWYNTEHRRDRDVHPERRPSPSNPGRAGPARPNPSSRLDPSSRTLRSRPPITGPPSRGGLDQCLQEDRIVESRASACADSDRLHAYVTCHPGSSPRTRGTHLLQFNSPKGIFAPHKIYQQNGRSPFLEALVRRQHRGDALVPGVDKLEKLHGVVLAHAHPHVLRAPTSAARRQAARRARVRRARSQAGRAQAPPRRSGRR